MRETHYATLNREDRQYTFDTVELRADDEGALTFDGVASVVDTPYVVRDMFGEFEETITSGAFKKTLREKDDVRLLVNHEGIPLARRRGSKTDTLALSADPHLRAVAPLDPSSPLVQTIRSAMDRRDMDQMSIGFRVTKQKWAEDYSVRTINEVQLFDVSLVTFPASPTTTAQLRSIDDLIAQLPADLDENELRRAITHLESLLPVEERVPVSSTYYANLRLLLDKKPAVRFADIYADDVRQRLRSALNDRFSPAMNQWIWVRDFTDTNVVFELEGFDESGTFRLSYSLDETGAVVLSGDPVEVQPTTSYTPAA